MVVVNILGHAPLLVNDNGGASLPQAFKHGVGTFWSLNEATVTNAGESGNQQHSLVASDLSTFQFMPVVGLETNNIQLCWCVAVSVFCCL